jgi:hypothetical protein
MYLFLLVIIRCRIWANFLQFFPLMIYIDFFMSNEEEVGNLGPIYDDVDYGTLPFAWE